MAADVVRDGFLRTQHLTGQQMADSLKPTVQVCSLKTDYVL